MFYLDMLHYADSFKYLIWATIPFDVSKLLNDLSVTAYLDFNDFKGQKLYTDKDTNPVEINGVP